tara:strand:+ start:15656 stop:16558 length:903 start_codon:yes stop_codon:yes gene_type:complete
MKILISGGSGFIGRNLLNYLNKNNMNIMLIGRNLDFLGKNNYKKKFLDLNDFNYDFREIKNFNPDIFLHLAWEGIPNYSEEFSKKNYLNTIRLTKMLVSQTSCYKIISTGSCWEYNDGNIEGRCNEDLLLNPKKPFSIYKHKIFKEIDEITKKKKITFNWLRLFYVYGPGQKKESIIPMLINNIKYKENISINFPDNINDYIYIDDAVRIIFIFLSSNIKSGIYNLGTGKGTKVKDLIKIIDHEINGNTSFSYKYLTNLNKNLRNQNFYACTEKLKKNINNFEFMNINTGIKKLIKSIYV